MKRNQRKHSSFIANFHQKKAIGELTPKAETTRFIFDSPKASATSNTNSIKEDKKLEGFHSHRRSNTSQDSPTLPKYNLAIDKANELNSLIAKENSSEGEETSKTERTILKRDTPDTLLSEESELYVHTEGDEIDRDSEKIINFHELWNISEKSKEYNTDLIENQLENVENSVNENPNDINNIIKVYDQIDEEKEIKEDIEEIEEKIDEIDIKKYDSEIVIIYFNVPYETKLGESIVVVGDTEKLGNWDANKGLKLEWSKGNFWCGNLKISREEAKYLEFKYAVTRWNGSKWEMGDNRKLHVYDNFFSCCCQHEFWQITKEKNPKNDMIKISFRISYRAIIGENLRIVGNSEKLGNWNFNKGLSLEWTRGHNWIGSIEIDKFEANNLEFKYVVAQNTYQKWERGNNHRLNCDEQSGGNFYLNDLWHA